MKSAIMVICAITAIAANAATTVYRLEADDAAGKAYIVGADGVSREVVLIAPEDYATLTNNVAETLRAMHSTEEGRRSLHGAKTSVEVADGEKTTIYADGYRHVEKLQIKPRPEAPKLPRLAPKTAAIRPRHISERLHALKQKVEAAKNAEPKTVTIEHDAATGTDKEVK